MIRLVRSLQLEEGSGKRIRDALHRKGIMFIEDITKHTKKQIKSLPNVGKWTVQRLEIWLGKHGLAFKAEPKKERRDKVSKGASDVHSNANKKRKKRKQIQTTTNGQT